METKTIKILAIDDNPDNLVVLKALLTEKFPEAAYLEALSGEKGIELCLAENPDVILLDIVMPLMDGHEVCRKIKSNDATNFIPVVMITASRGDTESRIKALESGADAFLTKPIDESELTAQIRAMIQIKKATEQKKNEKERLEALVEVKTRELTEELKRRVKAEKELKHSFVELEKKRQAELLILQELQVEINERKQFEDALSQSRKEFQNYFENAPIGMTVTSPDKKWVEVNQRLCQMLGYTKKELIGINWTDISHPDEIEQNLVLFQQAVDGIIDKYEIDKRFIRKNGTILYVTLLVVCQRNEDGKLHHLLSSYVDITDRRLAEQALKESEEHFRTLYENAPIGIYRTTPEGQILLANPVLVKLFGKKSFKELKQLNLALETDFVLNYSRKKFQEQIERDGKVEGLETKVIHKDGSEFYIRESAVLVRDSLGNPLYYDGTIEDITEQKLAEKALRDSEEYNRMLFEKSVIGLAVNGMDGKLVDVNQSYAKIIGRTIDETLQLSYWDITPKKYAEQEKMQLESLSISGYYGPYEKEYIHKDGHPVPVRLQGLIIEREGRKYIWSSVENITESKLAELKVKEHERQLSSMVGNLPGFIYRCKYDKHWTMLYLSEGCRSVTGYIPEDFIENKKLAFNDIIRVEYQPVLYKEWGIAVSNKTQFQYEYQIVTSDNEIKWVWERGVGIFDENDHLLFLEGYIEDVTQRKIAELQIIESEEKYRNLFNNSEVGMFRTRLDGSEILEFNEKYLKILNYTHEEVKGRPSVDIWADKNERDEMVKMLNAEGQVTDFECKLLTKQGNVRNCITSLRLYTDTGILEGSIYDITERKQAEEALLESEERYRLLFDNSMDAVLLTVPDGTILQANATACKIFGRTEEELKRVGRNAVVDMTDPRMEPALKKRITDGRYEGELTGLRKDGSKFPIEIASALFRDRNGNLRSSMIIKDITARKQAEEKLRLSEGRFRSLFENMVEGVAHCKMLYENDQPEDFLYMEVNESFGKLTGLKDVKGMKVSEVIPGIRQTDPELFEIYGRVASTGKPERLEIYLAALKMWLHISVYSPAKEYFVAVFDVITARKQAEESLREIQTQLASIYNTVVDVIFLLAIEGDETYRFISINPAFCSVTGLSKEMIIGKLVSEVIPEPSLSMVLDKYRQAVKEKSVINWEETTDYPSGRLTGEVNIAPIVDNKGVCTFLVGSVHDITERKKYEEALKESAQFNTQVIGSAHEGIIVYDLNLKYKVWNPYMEKLSGIPASEVLGKHPLDLFPFLKYAGVIDIINKASKGETCPMVEFPYSIPATGKTGWTSDTTGPLRNAKGEIIGAISTVRDITESKLAEEIMKNINERFELAANAAAISVWEYDLSTGIIKIDDNFNRIYGVPLGNYQIEFNEFIKFVHPDDTDILKINAREAITSDKNIKFEFRIIRPDGNIRNLETYIKIVKDKTNKPLRLIGVNIDITELKKAEQELITAKEKAEESDRLKSAFLATMNHELRTPLNHIIGFSELIQAGDKETEFRDYATIIQTSGKNLLSIIEGIFELSLAEHGNIKIQNQTFSLMDHFMENKVSLEDLLKSSGKNNTIELIFNPETKLLSDYITADRSRINQVLANLFKNAIKFTKSGKIEFGFATHDPGKLTFIVKDTGVGISKEKQKVIFEFFRQGDDTHTRLYGGTGIGLAIALKITQLLNGELRVESESGKGSSFFLDIPVEITEMGKMKVPSSQPKVNLDLSGKSILIVEDDPFSMSLIKTFLKFTGARIIGASDGKEALDKWYEYPDIDLVLMDLQMPVMDGFEATKIFKSQKSELPIIALTAYSLISDQLKAIDAGCNSIVAKPVDRVLLFGELKKMLS